MFTLSVVGYVFEPVVLSMFMLSVVGYVFEPVVLRMFTLSVVGYVLEPLSGQTKDYKIGICCFSLR
jgi:hypothetical protein